MSYSFSQRYRNQTVIQWKYCYLNYDHLKGIGQLLKFAVRQQRDLQQMIKTGTKRKIKAEKKLIINQVPISQQKMAQIKSYYQYFREKGEWAQSKFLQIHKKNMELFGDFTNWKYKQIKQHFQMCYKFNFLGGNSHSYIRYRAYKYYMQNLYLQSMNLCTMVHSNIQAQRRILSRHKLYALTVFTTPEDLAKYKVSLDQCNFLRKTIQRFYYKTVKIQKSKSRERLLKLAENKSIRLRQTFIIGLLIGTIITIIVFLVIILARASITLQSDPIFNMNFPLWRGISLILFFLWVLGVNVRYFQKYHIRYKPILENHQKQNFKSADLFKIAAFFSSIFIVVFILYSLQIADILQLGNFAPQWFPLFVWVPFVLFVFNPFHCLYFQSRVFFFKLFIKMVSTLVVKSTFPAVFMVAQALSLLNVFQDTVYTICYYTHLNLPFPLEQVQQENVCRPVSITAKFIYTIVIFSIRLVQLIRNGIGGKRTQFLSAIRISFSLITAILSYLWKQANNQHLFPAWLTFAIVSTICSFLWDVKMAWGLFNCKSKNFLLRDELIYPKINYYIWILMNILFRLAWTLNISPNIVRNFFASPQIFSMVFGYVQIIRRGIWNTIRLQVLQTANNQNLVIMPNQQLQFESTIRKYLQQNKNKFNELSTQQLYETQKHILIQSQILQKADLKKQKEEIMKKIKQFKVQMLQNNKILKQNTRQAKIRISILLKQIY